MQTQFPLQLLQQISPELSLQQANEIPLLVLKHDVGEAIISLQGAQLLSWKPAGSAQDLLWLSEIEPFQLGTAIRGGVPICFPWFNNLHSPAHGYARLRLWQLADYQFSASKACLRFVLCNQQNIVEASLSMEFSQNCKLSFTNYLAEPAQLALHSYFQVAHIEQTQVHNLGTSCFNSLSQQQEQVPDPRTINENVDCIYALQQAQQQIEDQGNRRTILVQHHNASEAVLWNPWHKATSNMAPQAHQHMLCLETARLSQRLQQGEQVAVEISAEELK